MTVTSGNTLRIEQIVNAPNESPCGEVPPTWVIGSGAVSMER